MDKLDKVVVDKFLDGDIDVDELEALIDKWDAAEQQIYEEYFKGVEIVYTDGTTQAL